jgi:hypothetical protein
MLSAMAARRERFADAIKIEPDNEYFLFCSQDFLFSSSQMLTREMLIRFKVVAPYHR